MQGRRRKLAVGKPEDTQTVSPLSRQHCENNGRVSLLISVARGPCVTDRSVTFRISFRACSCRLRLAISSALPCSYLLSVVSLFIRDGSPPVDSPLGLWSETKPPFLKPRAVATWQEKISYISLRTGIRWMSLVLRSIWDFRKFVRVKKNWPSAINLDCLV